MKFHETTFDEYINNTRNIDLHPELREFEESIPNKPINFKNMIIILVKEMKEVLYITTWNCVLFLFIIGSFLSYLYGGVGLSISLILTEIFNYFVCQFFIKKNESKYA